ncbi:MAG TPA: hypothetical protein VF433_12425 [Cellvibrio sp.]
MTKFFGVMIALLSIVVCLSLTWALYQQSIPFETQTDGLMFMFKALAICAPFIFANGFIQRKIN